MTRTSQVFNIAVSDGLLPTWFASVPDKQWINVRAASGQGDQLRDIVGGNSLNVEGQFQGYPGDEHIVGTWNTAIQLENHYAIVSEGGHRKSSDNGAYVFGPFNSETPNWVMALAPEEGVALPATGVPYYQSGKPASRHGYNHQCYIPDLGGGVGHQWFSMRCGAPYGRATGGDPDTDTLNFNSDPMTGGSYDVQGANESFQNGLGAAPGGCAYDSVNKRVYASGGSGEPLSRYLFEFNPYTRQWTSYGTTTTTANSRCAIVDPVRRLFIVVDADASPNGIGIWDLSTKYFAEFHDVLPSGTMLNTTGEPSLGYEPVGGSVVVYDGGSTIKKLTIPTNYRNGGEDTSQPITNVSGWSWDTISGISGTPPNSSDSGTFGKFGYISSIHAFAAQPGNDNDMWVFKIPENGL